ncbi:unnamed protein product [Parnassius apollo]|uniref:(apollo) hypothetical protein n=1 Tax=Parnassius apollo TaxID=110799 RepID=A0A8S3WC63_PARAO|nr:unnamed protein product [Parnassius apollo]
MNILNDIYEKKLTENEGKLRFWEDYLKSLKALDFSQFSDKLAVPILVPVGSRIFFRGYLKHTNEVTVALGADYFTKCSLQQGEILRQHRIKDAESKLDTFQKEKEYIESQISFNRDNVFGNVGQEIIELHTEEEDRAWREKHRQKVREYYQKKEKKEETQINEIPDEVLWNRLEELELQEELYNELSKLGNSEEMEVMIENNKYNKDEKENNEKCKKNSLYFSNLAEVNKDNGFVQLHSKPTEKLDLLQQVLDKQNELENKLTELKNRDRNSSKTESDLMSRLDELEQLDELEDEMDRLDDILHEENDEAEEGDKSNLKMKRGVSFADEDESETLELTFKHTEIEPCNKPYNPEIGIMKPSDIYTAYSHLFTETTSILRKTKYESSVTEPNIGQEKKVSPTVIAQNINTESRIIVVKDVKEKEVDMENSVDTVKTRPISIFKKRRQQKS